jgi:hypothetical protein
MWAVKGVPRRTALPSQRVLGKLARSASLLAAVAAIGWAALTVLATNPRPLNPQPFPDAAEYADSALQLVSGNGYSPTVHDGQRKPPRYPPGFALLLTPFVALGGDHPSGVQLGAKVIAVAYLLISASVAWLIAGPVAATVTALLIGVSPFVKVSAALAMSDALAAAVAVLILGLAQAPSPRRIAVAGLLCGILVTIRLSALVYGLALLLAVPAMFWRRLVLSALPPVLALGVHQWLTFGHPLQTGYNYWVRGQIYLDWVHAIKRPPFGDGAGIFADSLRGLLLGWVCPCPSGGPQGALPSIVFYPLLLLGLFWIFAPPLTPLLGLVSLGQHWRDTAARFVLWSMLLSFAFYTVYVYQAARFMAGPATMLAIYTGVFVANLVNAALARWRAPAEAHPASALA